MNDISMVCGHLRYVRVKSGINISDIKQNGRTIHESSRDAWFFKNCFVYKNYLSHLCPMSQPPSPFPVILYVQYRPVHDYKTGGGGGSRGRFFRSKFLTVEYRRYKKYETIKKKKISEPCDKVSGVTTACYSTEYYFPKRTLQYFS